MYRDIWEWCIDDGGKNFERVEKLCKRMGKEDSGEAVDAMIAHGARWLANYDPTRATLSTHILVQIGYALREKKTSQDLQELSNQPLEKVTYTNGRASSCQDMINEITSTLDKLSGYDRWLVVARHVHKLNFTDISKALGVCKGTVRKHYLKAIERAREYDTSKA